MEYCTIVWSLHTARNINKLERIQRRVSKFILKTDDDYETRKDKLNLLSLEDRCFFFDVLFFYKVLNGFVNIDISPLTDFYSHSDRYSLRGRDNLTLKKQFSRTYVFKFSYFNRILRRLVELAAKLNPQRDECKGGLGNFLTSGLV